MEKKVNGMEQNGKRMGGAGGCGPGCGGAGGAFVHPAPVPAWI